MKFKGLIPTTGILLVSCGTGVLEEAKSPNVIYVFPDQFRNASMSFWDDENYAKHINFRADPVLTPNLNKFASESMVITDAVSTFPLSSPHRGMLLSGMYPERNGVVLNCMSERPESYLRADVTTISDVFSDAGYNCAYLGKYHLDYPTKNNPQNIGTYVEDRLPVWDAYTPKELRHKFDFWYSYGTFNEHNNPHYWDNNGDRHDPKMWSPEHEVDVAIDYINNVNSVRDEDKPFFMVVSMNPPHSPYESLDDCLEEDYNLYKDKSSLELLVRPNVDHDLKKTDAAPYYFANVTGVDREFGRLLQALEDAGLDENTIVVFSSDHGETMCSQGIDEPKNTIYSESFNIPFIVRYPNHITPEVTNLMLGTPDVMPTLLGLAGLSESIPSSVEGRDFSSIFVDGANKAKRPTAALYMRNVNGVKGEDNMVSGFHPQVRGVKTDNYSMAITIDRSLEVDDILIFDDKNDPYQMKPLNAEKNKEIFEMLCGELAVILKESNDVWYRNGILSDIVPYKK